MQNCPLSFRSEFWKRSKKPNKYTSILTFLATWKTHCFMSSRYSLPHLGTESDICIDSIYSEIEKQDPWTYYGILWIAH